MAETENPWVCGPRPCRYPGCPCCAPERRCRKCGEDLRYGENIADGSDDDTCYTCDGYRRCPLCGTWAHPDDSLRDNCGYPYCTPGILPSGEVAMLQGGTS